MHPSTVGPKRSTLQAIAGFYIFTAGQRRSEHSYCVQCSSSLPVLEAQEDASGTWPFMGVGTWTPGDIAKGSPTLTNDDINKSAFFNFLDFGDQLKLTKILTKAATFADKGISQTKYAKQALSIRNTKDLAGPAVFTTVIDGLAKKPDIYTIQATQIAYQIVGDKAGHANEQSCDLPVYLHFRGRRHRGPSSRLHGPAHGDSRVTMPNGWLRAEIFELQTDLHHSHDTRFTIGTNPGGEVTKLSGLPNADDLAKRMANWFWFIVLSASVMFILGTSIGQCDHTEASTLGNTGVNALLENDHGVSFSDAVRFIVKRSDKLDPPRKRDNSYQTLYLITIRQ
ncbi:hypothetical protein QBC45DRAFT_433000 [Copromyces sp. CBS 386.78]|nr:hypothetical protein QBC45DRAFT_433000 [Copromyces sp. CBS 386.78]